MLGDGLQAYNLDNKDVNPEDDDPFDEYITAVEYEIHYAYHQTHGHSPGQLVYGPDMFLPVDHKIDWEKMITKKKTREDPQK